MLLFEKELEAFKCGEHKTYSWYGYDYERAKEKDRTELSVISYSVNSLTKSIIMKYTKLRNTKQKKQNMNQIF